MKIFLASLLVLAVPMFSCKKRSEQKKEDVAAEVKNLPATKGIPYYGYFGPLIKLTEPRLFVAIEASTLRVQGWLPPSFDVKNLPAYAYADMESVEKGTRIQIVYPIATAAEGDSDRYVNVRATPYDSVKVMPRITDKHHWAGFPFIAFIPGTDLYGFHGPITGENGDIDPVSGNWELIRGAVSHGCHRMQGEHAVELAQLLGVDMKTEEKVKAYNDGTEVTNKDNYQLLVTKAVDKIADGRFAGKLVDVNYTRGGASFEAPTSNVMKFDTWDGMDVHFVCDLSANTVGTCRKFNDVYKRSSLGDGSENVGAWKCEAGQANTCVAQSGKRWSSLLDAEGNRHFKETETPLKVGPKFCRFSKNGQEYFKTGRDSENKVLMDGDKPMKFALVATNDGKSDMFWVPEKAISRCP